MSTAVSDCIHDKCVIKWNELEIVTDKTYDRNGNHSNEPVDRKDVSAIVTDNLMMVTDY